MKLILTLLGRDSWDRPVYEANRRLYVDTNPRKCFPPNICTKNNNAFDGEPSDSVSTEVEFIPARDTWD